MEQNKLEAEIKLAKNIALGIILLVPLIYFVWFYLCNQIPISLESNDWGAFGSFFGGILSPVIALFAFYWLTQSILIQKKELSETQKVLAETEKVQKEQAITQEKKRFEDTFHSLLNQMNVVFSDLNHQLIIHEKPQKSQIGQLYQLIAVSELPNKPEGNKSEVQVRAEMMRKASVSCSHYFRILYHLLKFVLLNKDFKGRPQSFEEALRTEVSDVEKFYTNIVRSFLNREVTQLLAINCISEKGDDFYKYRLLIERYALLEHIRFDKVWSKELIDQYESSAFGSNPEAKATN
ncbi:putative phage abortive infection protein [Pseudoalteromonas sp. T1lg122]|uniref:putative phage abortive infection protein n=1 Tax=Pseudoalteromonas sp. T1lg122 TaxID=2077094 RepID=UPI000CF6E3F8|nr:putative phage abortive infection protein [Pseudoalteromonas sp. T1lg122]